MSAVPAFAVFVGLIRRGEPVVQAPELWAVHPTRTVMTVPAVTAPVVSQKILGDVTYEFVLQVILLVTTADGSPPVAFRLLKAKEVAEGEAVLSAEPGKFIVTLPPAGIPWFNVN